MAKSIISEGKTTNEAIEKGIKELKVSKDMVEVKILDDEDKRSFFSILTPRVVKVELTVKEDVKKPNKEKIEHKEKRDFQVSMQELEKAKENVECFLKDFVANMSEEAKYNVEIKDNGLEVEILGEDVGFLIGYRGDTLYSLQNILTSVANKNITKRVRVLLDIAGYKQKRIQTLEELADRIARTVVKTKKDVTLEPMQPYERKIIHSKLQENSKVTTKSIGEEPRRRIVVSLNK